MENRDFTIGMWDLANYSHGLKYTILKENPKLMR